VQYHLKTDQGIKNLAREEATCLSGENPDHATQDLIEAIAKGDFPSWTMAMQIMTPEQAQDYRWDILDITKVWPHGDFPLIKVGKLVLNRNPSNYFAEVEQAAFNPSSLVPGIAASPDKMLQARLFSYHDTHLHRLGPNYHLLPINTPKYAPQCSYQRDGAMRCDDGGSGPNYWPNSFGGPAPDPDLHYDEPKLSLAGMVQRHHFVPSDEDFVQAGNLYRKVMTDMDREHLVGNIVDHLGGAAKRIQLRQSALFFKADPDYGKRVAEGLGLELAEVERLAQMSQVERAEATS
jgi:catalase